jgi:hypothetical protein
MNVFGVAQSSLIRLQALLAALVVGLSGCSLAMAPPSVVAGQRFPQSGLVKIQRGTPTDEVLRIGGPPFERRPTQDGEVWRYFMTVEQVEHVKFVSVVPMPSRRAIHTFETTFVMRGGQVAEVKSRDSAGPQ